jgi:hypothetical protein
MESKAGIKVKTEVYSRISGYYRPVVQWNKAKQAEFKERKDLQFSTEKRLHAGPCGVKVKGINDPL